MDTKLKCLLLDDEHLSLTYLKLLCQQIPELEVIKTFDSPREFIDNYSKYDFNLVILDIDMPEINGLQIAEILVDKPLIFTTAYPEYAADAFDLQAIDFVRKPLKLDRLKQAVQRLRAEKTNIKEKQNKFVQLNTDSGRFLLYFEKILFIRTAENDSRDKEVMFNDQTSVIVKNISFEKLLTFLPSQLFCRINKREVIALHTVLSFSHDEIKSNITIEKNRSVTFYLGEVYKQSFVEKISL